MYQAPPPLPDDPPPPSLPPRREVFAVLGLIMGLAGAATLLGLGEFQDTINSSAVIAVLIYILWSAWRTWSRSR